jgi:nucleosome binding factor SPN SPT16 subunit
VHLIKYIKPGKQICDIFNEAINFIKSNKNFLEKYLNKSIGHGIGLE